MLFEHTEQANELFGFPVGVDDGFFHERIQPAFTQRRMASSLGGRRGRRQTSRSRHVRAYATA
jgi:hypothetical protein